MADENYKLFNPSEGDAAAETGYKKDSNGVWWLITKVPVSPLDSQSGEIWVFRTAIMSPNNPYGITPGYVTGTNTSAQGASDAVEEFALRWKLKHPKTEVSLLPLLALLALVLLSDKRR